MKKINKVYCFFEQSGIFRDAFISLGIPAEDYDIENSFGQPLIDSNRSLRGDTISKPTAYWFFNIEPTQGSSYLPTDIKKASRVPGLSSIDRSPSLTYAINFIADFILGVPSPVCNQLNLL